MSTPSGGGDSTVATCAWQIRLADLIVLVLAVGVAAGIARGAREAWGSRMIPGGKWTTASSVAGVSNSIASPVPPARTAGVVFEVISVFLIVLLARSVFSMFRPVRPWESGQGVPIIWAVAWRCFAVVILLGFVADESSVLRIDFARETEFDSRPPGWGPDYRVRQNLLPVCGALAMVGLALGMGAGAFFEERPSPRRRPTWLFVPLAGVFAVLLAVGLYGYSIIAQLVLIALEAVSNAMYRTNHAGPGLAVRLIRAGLDALAAFIACVALGIVVAGDFERARRGEPWATTRAGRVRRLALLLATIGAGAYVAVRTIPGIHPSFAAGFAQVLDPGVCIATLGGFGLFAAGLAARSVVPRPSREIAAWVSGFSAMLRYGLLLVLLLAALKQLPASSQLPSGISAWVGRVIDGVGHAQAWLWGLIPYPVVLVLTACLEPELLQWLIALVFSVILVVELAVRPAFSEEAPFDAILKTKRSAIEVIWLTVAFTVLCVAAMPTLIVAGQVLMHVRLSISDWMEFGWPV
jgi:hypothetical protein